VFVVYHSRPRFANGKARQCLVKVSATCQINLPEINRRSHLSYCGLRQANFRPAHDGLPEFDQPQ
jgi:hypothetical protein